MNEDEMNEAIDELINSDGEVEIEGLDFDSVVTNFVDTKYKDQINSIEDETQRKELRDKWLNYYKTGDGKEAIQSEINSIKSNFSAAKDGLTYCEEAAASSIADNAIPSVITVGTATSTPNPAYTLIENKTKKNNLLSMLKQIGNALAQLLISALKIAFSVPIAIATLITTLASIKKTVNAIPV